MNGVSKKNVEKKIPPFFKKNRVQVPTYVMFCFSVKCEKKIEKSEKRTLLDISRMPFGPEEGETIYLPSMK